MSFERAARKVVEADAQAGGSLSLSKREELFFRGLRAEGYGDGLDWLTHKSEHVKSCTNTHTVDLEGSTGNLARDLLKLVSYGYMKDLMQRRFNLSLAYPALDTVMFGAAATQLQVPAYTGNLQARLERNPLATRHLLSMAERVAASGEQLVDAVSPKTEVAAQLLNLLAGESLRAAVIEWLSRHAGSPLDGNWYGCCAPAIAPKGKLILTFEEQLKYQTDPTVMC